MTKTIKTRLITYKYDTSDPKQAKNYQAFCKKLAKTNNKKFDIFVDYSKYHKLFPRNTNIEIETPVLFGRQFNTICGKRVHMWFEAIYPNKNIKEGYYIIVTPELKEATRNTVKCGYCGHVEPAQIGNVFCDKCLDSEYLNKKDLYLLRMIPVKYTNKPRPPLTKPELAHLLPLFVKRQITGANSRNAKKLKKQRRDIKEKCKKEIRTAKEERDGLIWLMNNNVNIDNVIYYNHTESFKFGWRNPMDYETVKELLGVISEFQHVYTINGYDENGKQRTWEGY